MIIYLGADHKGFKMKNLVKVALHDRGYEIIDLGADAFNKDDDYVDFASKLGERLSTEFANAKGVLICGSGVGMSVAVNKYPNIRAALVLTPDQAYDARKEDDANVLVLAASHTDEAKVKSIISTFFETPFEPVERYLRRIKKINEIEISLLKQ